MKGDAEERPAAGKQGDVVPATSLTRRSLFEAAGAVAAIAGAEACSRGPQEYIIPYVNQPPEVTPGVPTHYATTMVIGGYAIGMLVESHEGRPTKAEGNPLHPASLGALGTLEQASVLALYEPARAREVHRADEISTWTEFEAAISTPPAQGKKTHVLLEPTCSPHLIDLIGRARAKGVVVHFHSPVSRDAEWAGTNLAFGRVVEPRWDFARADVVLALDSDFLLASACPMAWARGWAAKRRLPTPGGTMSRLYTVEGRLTVTGISADDRLAVRPSEVRDVAAAVLSYLATGDGPAGTDDALRAAAALRPSGGNDRWATKVAKDLQAHAGACAVIAGQGQPASVHAMAHAMNLLLGNVGKTVAYGPPTIFEAGEGSHGLEPLLHAIDAGVVQTLVIVGGDPVYTSEPNFELARRIQAVPTSAYVGAYENATARACIWSAPEAHFLEAWGDATAFEGTPSIAQPLIRPFVDGRTPAQVLAALAGQPGASSRELVLAYWRGKAGPGFDTFWRRALLHGIIEGQAPPPVDVKLDSHAISSQLAAPTVPQLPQLPQLPLEIAYFVDNKVYDGRFAHVAHLQELADPITKLTWDNAALVSPGTAKKYQLGDEDVVELTVRKRAGRAAVLVVPSMADDLVAIALGYGQQTPGTEFGVVGTNAYALRDSRAPWADDASLRKTGESWNFAVTQEHSSQHDRPIVLSKTIADYKRRPDFAKSQNDVPTSLYNQHPTATQQWGMTIDLNTCTGCSACVVACMTENNVPVVGKAEVRLGREMHWLRIDRYFNDDAKGPPTVVQPMLCQHCEKAPCEYVCPVNATVHSPDGLNEMVYNRCVGTRFCSNNCPYKVRRFNFFNNNWRMPKPLYLAMNPDVTVRGRGVMEKCSYCVQRIREADIASRNENRPIRDGEVVTACQQTCPTGAIVFGDIARPDSAVAETRKDPRLYAVLESLGTLPRTRYLARITNPNPELAPT